MARKKPEPVKRKHVKKVRKVEPKSDRVTMPFSHAKGVTLKLQKREKKSEEIPEPTVPLSESTANKGPSNPY